MIRQEDKDTHRPMDYTQLNSRLESKLQQQRRDRDLRIETHGTSLAEKYKPMR